MFSMTINLSACLKSLASASLFVALGTSFFATGCSSKKKDKEKSADEESGSGSQPIARPPGPGSAPAYPNPSGENPAAQGFRIDSWTPLIASEGARVTLSGANMTRLVEVTADHAVIANLDHKNDTEVSFEVVSVEKAGAQLVHLRTFEEKISMLLYFEGSKEYPVYTGDPAHLCRGSKFFDANGVLGEGKKSCFESPLPDCKGTGDHDCIVTEGQLAVDAGVLRPGIIKAGVSVGGVVGNFPSSTSPLSQDAAVPDLDQAEAHTGTQTYRYFGNDGRAHTLRIASVDPSGTVTPRDDIQSFQDAGTFYRPFAVAGDGNLRAANIRSGVSIFGIPGIIAARPYDCAGDNETECVASDAFPSVIRSSVLSSVVRSGSRIAGVTGSLKFCRSGSDLSTFDNQTPPARVGLDPFDSIDDYNNYSQAQMWPGASAFSEQVLCSAAEWHVGPDAEACLRADGECFIEDKMTGLSWTKLSPGGISKTWNEAISICDGLVFAGYDDWRLPTQKELLQAYIDGIAGFGNRFRHFGGTRIYHWSATTVSTPTGAAREFPNAWVTDLSNATTTASLKTTRREYRCVR